MFSLFVCFVVVSSNVFKIFEGLLLLGVIFCVWSEHFQWVMIVLMVDDGWWERGDCNETLAGRVIDNIENVDC